MLHKVAKVNFKPSNFRYLKLGTAGLPLALVAGMELQITANMLQHLSKQIASGKVVWSLLTLNEYEGEKKDPLLSSLRLKAKQQIAKAQENYNSTYIGEILAGKKLSEFTDEDKDAIKSIKEDIKKRRPYFVSNPRSLWSSRRRSYVLVNSTKREASSGD